MGFSIYPHVYAFQNSLFLPKDGFLFGAMSVQPEKLQHFFHSKQFHFACMLLSNDRLQLLEQFQAYKTFEQEVLGFLINPTSLTSVCPVITSYMSSIQLLMSQYWYSIINSRPPLIPLFTLCVGYSMGFDKCIRSCIHHYVYTEQFHCQMALILRHRCL